MIDSLNVLISSAPNSLKAVIFDLGGVVVDLQIGEAEHNLQAFFHTHSAFFGSALHEQLLKGFISFTQFWETFSSRFSIESSAEKLNEFRSLWNSAIRGLNSTMIKFIQQLSLNYPTIKRYVLSNTDEQHWEYLKPLFPSPQIFDATFFSFQLGLTKPDPQIFTQILEITALTAQNCLFIDDSLENILAAQQLGFKTFHYRAAK